MSFGKIFARRSAICFFMICMLFLCGCLRLYSVASGPYAAAQQKQSSLRLPVMRPRATVYDRNRVPFNNTERKIMAAVAPTPYASFAISAELNGSAKAKEILSKLSEGKPVICELPVKTEGDGIVCIEVPYTKTNSDFAIHTVGYTDKSGHGAAGIQKAFDELLYSKNTVDAVFKTDGMGRIMEGEKIEIQGNPYLTGNSVVTTLDCRIQLAAEKTAEKIKKGAITVADAKTGEILAAVSKPGFSAETIEEYLECPDSPLINRCLLAYSVGSVFKPCVAAAAIENGLESFTAECSGSVEIKGRLFRCHDGNGHGTVNLETAIAQSCNSYFYQLGLKTGRKSLFDMASVLNFGHSVKLCNGMETKSGSTESFEALENECAIANMSIGQGKLLLSPVSMITLYSSIASDGCYRLPTLIKSVTENGQKKNFKLPSATRVMTEKTAKKLKNALIKVITDGTGKDAAPGLCTAAGKTATAQTGKYKNGREITNGWFCGFFPAESPRFVAIIMEEDAIGSDVSPLFSELADRIIEIENKSVLKK